MYLYSYTKNYILEDVSNHYPISIISRYSMRALFIVCMLVRFSMAYLAKVAPLKWLRWMGYLAILPVIGFTYFFLSGTRNKTGAFGEKVWWNSLRPIHALFYGLFAYLAIHGNRTAWVCLFADACVGLAAFLFVIMK
jgi:hypothetical protein